MVTTITVSLVGTALLILTVLDVIATAMGASGGVLVRHLTPLMWRIGCLPCSLGGWHRYRSRLGICIVLTTITLWLVSFWFGWVLVFHGSPEAVVNTETELPASTLERAYFVGFTVSTLGLGDFKAGGQLWKILTVVCSTSGFLLVTFVITYLIPLIQAATHQRAVAVRISAIGESADQIVRRCYDGAGLRALEDHLTDLSSELALLEQRHHTYPVLYYMHSIAKPESIALSIAALDEAMTIVELGLVDRGGVGEPQLEHARQIVTQYLHTLGARHVSAADDAPPIPTLHELRRQGLPVLPQRAFERGVGRIAERRRMLRGMVNADGWRWSDLRRNASRSPLVGLHGDPEADTAE